jgi:hypothetical protein
MLEYNGLLSWLIIVGREIVDTLRREENENMSMWSASYSTAETLQGEVTRGVLR